MSTVREPTGGEGDEILRHVPAACFTGSDYPQIKSGGVGVGEILAVWRNDRMLDRSLGRVGGDSLFGDLVKLWHLGSAGRTGYQRNRRENTDRQHAEPGDKEWGSWPAAVRGLLHFGFRGDISFDGGWTLLLVHLFNEAVFCNFYIAEEAVADCGHGGNEAGLMDVVSEQLSQEREAAGQGVLRDGDVAPDGIEQFFFGDELVRVAEQEEQDAKCLRLHGEHLAVSCEAELTFSNFDIGKAENE